MHGSQVHPNLLVMILLAVIVLVVESGIADITLIRFESHVL
jgi:hypothetical protein